MCCMMQSVRVVQRNLVYVVGLAMDICYEDVLRGSEYFGQFGKPVKVGNAVGRWEQEIALVSGVSIGCTHGSCHACRHKQVNRCCTTRYCAAGVLSR